MYTDGVIEARTAIGEYFGIDRLRDFVNNALTDRLPTAETMRRLVHAILNHQNDNLQDDATALLIEWRPTSTPRRSPADRLRESNPGVYEVWIAVP